MTTREAFLAREYGMRRAAIVVLVLGLQFVAMVLARGDHSLWPVALPWLASLFAATAAARPAMRGDLRLWLAAHWREGVLVTGLTLLGAALRLPGLETLPSGIYGDEGEFGTLALAVAEGAGPAPFGTAFLGDPALYTHLLAPFVSAFGPTMEAIRLPSALAGTATVPILYLLVRDLYGRVPATLAALLLATSAVHVHFSRLALNVVWVPLFACLALWLLWRGIARREDGWFLLVGIATGLSFYFHFGARLLALIVFLVLAGQVVVALREWRRWVRPALLVAMGAFLALSPLLAHLSNDPSQFTAHMEQRGIWNHWTDLAERYDTVPGNKIGILGYQTLRTFAAFVTLRDSPYGARIYTFMGEPMLSPLVGILALAGLAALCLRLKHGPARLLVIWFGVPVVFASILTDVAGQAHRLINPLLPAIIAAALVIDWVRRQVQARAPASVATGAAALVIAIPLLAGLWAGARYFQPDATGGFGVAGTAQARCMEALPPDTVALVAGAPLMFANHGPSRYLGHDIDRRDLTDPAAELPVDTQERPLVIMVHEDNRHLLGDILAVYPGAVSVEVDRPPGNRALTVIAQDDDTAAARAMLSRCRHNASR